MAASLVGALPAKQPELVSPFRAPMGMATGPADRAPRQAAQPVSIRQRPPLNTRSPAVPDCRCRAPNEL